MLKTCYHWHIQRLRVNKHYQYSVLALFATLGVSLSLEDIGLQVFGGIGNFVLSIFLIGLVTTIGVARLEK